MSGGAASIAGASRRVLIPVDVPAPRRNRSGETLIQLGGRTMGTTWSIKAVVPPGTSVADLRRGIEGELGRVVAQMSTWEPQSDISRFNAAPAGSWHELAAEFHAVLSAALDLAERTGGAYDPAVGAAVNLWGFGPEPSIGTMPSPDRIEAARARCGWHRVAFDKAAKRVRQPGGVALDLSSIAKGFGVDQVARYLVRAGIANALVEIGGELRGEGLKPDGAPWWVELEGPRAGAGLPETVVALAGLSVATSGDYRRYAEIEGRRYAHTIDPRTGCPLDNDVASVTVLAPDCMSADALATALMVLGSEAGLAFAEENAVAARFITASGGSLVEHITSAMTAMLD